MMMTERDQTRGSMRESNKVFVGGLSPDTTKDSLQSYFEQFGKVVDAVVMRDPETQKSRRFGFVTFESGRDTNAVLSMQLHLLDDKEIECKKACPRNTNSSSNNSYYNQPAEKAGQTDKVFVGGLPTLLSTDEFRDYFSKFGRVTHAVIINDANTGRSRGFGFVTFAKPETVDELCSRKSQYKICGKNVDVKKAPSKSKTNDGSNRDEYRKGSGGGGRSGARDGSFGGDYDDKGNSSNSGNYYYHHHSSSSTPYSSSHSGMGRRGNGGENDGGGEEEAAMSMMGYYSGGRNAYPASIEDGGGGGGKGVSPTDMSYRMYGVDYSGAAAGAGAVSNASNQMKGSAAGPGGMNRYYGHSGGSPPSGASASNYAFRMQRTGNKNAMASSRPAPY